MTAPTPIPVVCFVARSGTGKTTLLERVIASLSRRGLRVLAIKHDVHGFEVDKPGKDSWRLRQAGAAGILLASREQLALMRDVDGDLPLVTLLERYGGDFDVVLTEGFRQSAMPKVLVAREGAKSPFEPGEAERAGAVAVVADYDACAAAGLDLPLFALDEPEALVDFLVARFLGEAGQTRVERRLTGVLLAGGQSRRMGRDKAWMELDGELVLPQLVERLAPLCAGGVLVVRRAGQELPPLPAAARVVDDLLPDQAALGGLFTGLALASTPHVFLAACDLALLDGGFVDWLRGLPPSTADVLLPVRDGHAEPTHAIYGHRCLGAIKRALLSGELRLHGWYGDVRVQRVSEAEWRLAHPSGRSFVNVNTEADRAEAERLERG